MFEWLINKLPNRDIYRRDNSLYLTRYYLLRKPVKWFPSIYIHCFHSSDMDQELHNHPWTGSFSLILRGKYLEEYLKEDGTVGTKIYKLLNINLVGANKFHRIELQTTKVYTLFISGPKVQTWGFLNRDTKKYYDSEEFERMKMHESQQIQN